MDIVTTVFESARSGITRARIMYNAYLSYAQTVEYLEFLQENGLIKHDAGSKLYRTTAKGLKFLSASNKVNRMMGVPDPQ